VLLSLLNKKFFKKSINKACLVYEVLLWSCEAGREADPQGDSFPHQQFSILLQDGRCIPRIPDKIKSRYKRNVHMENQNLLPTIKALLDETDAVIAGLNAEGSKLFSEGKYEQARALLDKVDDILAFRGKVLCLQGDWKALRVPPIEKLAGSERDKALARFRPKPLKPGLKTAPEEFRYPLLEALVRLDGTARVGDVFRIVEEIMGEQLNTYDYQPLPSNRNTVRWKTSVHRERYNLVQEGLLAEDSPRGVWEISEAGREALKHAKRNPDLQRKLWAGEEIAHSS
jgi:hypothetical protein